MGFFSSMKHKSPEEAAKFHAILKKGIAKPKSFIDSSGGGHKHMKLGKNGKYTEVKSKALKGAIDSINHKHARAVKRREDNY